MQHLDKLSKLCDGTDHACYFVPSLFFFTFRMQEPKRTSSLYRESSQICSLKENSNSVQFQYSSQPFQGLRSVFLNPSVRGLRGFEITSSYMTRPRRHSFTYVFIVAVSETSNNFWFCGQTSVFSNEISARKSLPYSHITRRLDFAHWGKDSWNPLQQRMFVVYLETVTRVQPFTRFRGSLPSYR